MITTTLVSNLVYQDMYNQLVSGPQVDWLGNVLAGLLVGFGTRLGNGCTSGHGEGLAYSRD